MHVYEVDVGLSHIIQTLGERRGGVGVVKLEAKTIDHKIIRISK